MFVTYLNWTEYKQEALEVLIDTEIYAATPNLYDSGRTHTENKSITSALLFWKRPMERPSEFFLQDVEVTPRTLWDVCSVVIPVKGV